MITQIYEIQSPEQAEMMIQLDVDHVGSVLISAEHWQDAQIKEAVQTVQAAGRKSCLIPLFTNVDRISQTLDYHRPDIVHFCETLPVDADFSAIEPILERQRTIGQRFKDIEIMRSIPIGQKGHPNLVASLKLAKAFEPVSNWFLTDTLLATNAQSIDKDQPVSGYVGITGITCDWDIASQLVKQSTIPVILAGGLGPDNVTEAIAHTRPAGVDSCTQTNKTDSKGKPIRFQKDTEKVRVMVERARTNGFKD